LTQRLFALPHLIAREQSYQDLGYDYFDRLSRQRVSRRLVQRLEAMGFRVTVQEAERPVADQSLAAA
jgi:hypothetical protein